MFRNVTASNNKDETVNVLTQQESDNSTNRRREPVRHADILIVDDTVANLELLSSVLKADGYKVRPATNGRQALRAAIAAPPDLILLDIDMPEMNGFDVCRQLRAKPELDPVPIIFVSSFDGVQDKVSAFAAGGVDYITKPFQAEEVQQRVATHLRLEELKRRLAEQNIELQKRNQELEKLRALQNNLGNMVVHDLRSPIAGAIGYLELLQIGGADQFDEEQHADIRKAIDACFSANDLVNSLLSISRMESSAMPLEIVECDVKAASTRAIEVLASLRGERRLHTHIPTAPVHANADAELTQRVVTNLLQNAISATSDSGLIKLSIRRQSDDVIIEVSDDGCGIETKFLPDVFEKYQQADIRQQDRGHRFGIGLAFCKLAVEAQGGEIGVDSQIGKGSRFWFTLPRTVDVS